MHGRRIACRRLTRRSSRRPSASAELQRCSFPYVRMAFVMGYCYSVSRVKTRFDWDPDKDAGNKGKHGVSFSRAQYAFADPQRVIANDETHSQTEERFYCFGEVDGGVLTVRFTCRASVIRIIGAGYRCKGKAIHECENEQGEFR